MAVKIQVPPMAVAAGVAVIVAGVLLWKGSKVAVQAAGEVAHAVNPLNNENVFATTVNDVGAKIAGEPAGSWSLGSWIYDVTHPDDYKP